MREGREEGGRNAADERQVEREMGSGERRFEKEKREAKDHRQEHRRRENETGKTAAVKAGKKQRQGQRHSHEADAGVQIEAEKNLQHNCTLPVNYKQLSVISRPLVLSCADTQASFVDFSCEPCN